MKHRLWFCFLLILKLRRVSYQIVYGLWRISKLPQPFVSIFGGARIVPGDIYAQQADNIAHILTEAHISVITGGGAGIMEAASCGVVKAPEKKGRSIGITVKGLGQGENACVQDHIQVDYFFARKWLMIHYSSAFVIFPGGFGTLDELAEVLTLMQTKKIAEAPVILMGVEYWKPLVNWLKGEAFQHNLIDAYDLKLFVVTDDLHEALQLIKKHCGMQCPVLHEKRG